MNAVKKEKQFEGQYCTPQFFGRSYSDDDTLYRNAVFVRRCRRTDPRRKDPARFLGRVCIHYTIYLVIGSWLPVPFAAA